MDAIQSLTYTERGTFEWRERAAPTLQGPGEALVRPVAASICDIDRPLIDGRSPWRGPFAFGHEAVAEVLEVGDGVTAVAPGSLVAVAWHISCGSCARCRRGLTAYCTSVPPGAMFGLPAAGEWGGLFDDVVRVPFADAMLTVVPDGIEPLNAVSAGDNLSLGYGTVRAHLDRGAQRFLVLGSGAVGVTHVAFATALADTEVVYIDADPDRREVARGLGAQAHPGPPDRSMGRFDVVVDAGFDPTWLRRGLRMVEPDGVVECLGGYFEDVEVPMFAMYVEGATLRCGRANNGPNIEPTLTALAQGVVTPSTWSQPVEWDDAPLAVADPTLKPVALRTRSKIAEGGIRFSSRVDPLPWVEGHA